ncbi:HAD domain-containing protein [Mucilaginibacter psychrotolerans]|uniref:FCP1 homology domain-containing protein n=1 Tax=Mucilaginibacter psychrotolerans TaxID=1524096 RepID=A0A4Y8S600_9SPHI|nr:HAD domain-containing protein [Mucilaginibacter psychrotolerans]TFF34429.1 hypothetical protein E2R66_22410 [Mucilaginibacter psychrotolerans]
MFILLDIDGVMVTEPAWKKVEIAADGFMVFNEKSAKNLAEILISSDASVVLTTTHRINYPLDKWLQIFAARGITIKSISKLNNIGSVALMQSRAVEIQDWVNLQDKKTEYLIIDDDASLNTLPEHIKARCVITKSTAGFDDEAKQKALQLIGVNR